MSLPRAEESGVIRLPLTALFSQNGQDAVWLLDAASLSVGLQPVEVARTEGDEVIVASGLKAGDEVVIAGTHLLAPGLVVKRFVAPPAMAASR